MQPLLAKGQVIPACSTSRATFLPLGLPSSPNKAIEKVGIQITFFRALNGAKCSRIQRLTDWSCEAGAPCP